MKSAERILAMLWSEYPVPVSADRPRWTWEIRYQYPWRGSNLTDHTQKSVHNYGEVPNYPKHRTLIRICWGLQLFKELLAIMGFAAPDDLLAIPISWEATTMWSTAVNCAEPQACHELEWPVRANRAQHNQATRILVKPLGITSRALMVLCSSHTRIKASWLWFGPWNLRGKWFLILAVLASLKISTNSMVSWTAFGSV